MLATTVAGKIAPGGPSMRAPTRWAGLTAALAAVMALALPAAAKPGSLDTTYGQNGWAFAPFRACDCGGNASMRVQPDGKVVALGATGLARFLSTGALDRTFGNGGVVPLNLATASPLGLTL